MRLALNPFAVRIEAPAYLCLSASPEPRGVDMGVCQIGGTSKGVYRVSIGFEGLGLGSLPN